MQVKLDACKILEDLMEFLEENETIEENFASVYRLYGGFFNKKEQIDATPSLGVKWDFDTYESKSAKNMFYNNDVSISLFVFSKLEDNEEKTIKLSDKVIEALGKYPYRNFTLVDRIPEISDIYGYVIRLRLMFE